MASDDLDDNLALFCDFENVALGVRDARMAKFDMQLVLERLLLKGSIVVKKAYCDWERYKDFKKAMHDTAFELIEIPHTRQSGKNSADIRMVVDALDLCYTKEHIDTFVIISGDSDFSPLVSKLRENAKTVIGIGVKNSTSDLLMNNCDEFIFYDDLVRESDATETRRRPARRKAAAKVAGPAAANDETAKPAAAKESAAREGTAKEGAAKEGAAKDGAAKDGAAKTAPAKDAPAKEAPSREAPAKSGGAKDGGNPDEGIELVVETADALSAERGTPVWGSMVKQTLKRRRPGFSEGYYGFRSFGDLLEEAENRGLLDLELDDRSGGYVIKAVHRGD